MPVPFDGTTEEICVSALSARDAIEMAEARATDPLIAQTRAALVRGRALPDLSSERIEAAMVAYASPPVPPRSRFEARTLAAIDPDDPTHGWVTVEAATPLGRTDVPLVLTVLLDVSDSMYSAPLASVPVLQTQADHARPIQRIELARTALEALAARMPSRATLSVVAFEQSHATISLPPTPPTEQSLLRRALLRSTQDLARSGARSPLDVAYELTSAVIDGCADRRVLLVTDDRARIDMDTEVVERALSQWSERGIELWTLSLGTEGVQTEQIGAYNRAGRGVLVRADTLSEAVEPLIGALRANGTAVRDPAVSVTFGEGVASWRRVDRPSARGRSDAWALPGTLQAGWRQSALYELTLDPERPAEAPLASVSWKAGSPVPGDWTVARTDEARPVALPDADAPLRHRVFALSLARELAETPTSSEALSDRAGSLVREDGPARELAAWVDLLSAAP